MLDDTPPGRGIPIIPIGMPIGIPIGLDVFVFAFVDFSGSIFSLFWLLLSIFDWLLFFFLKIESNSFCIAFPVLTGLSSSFLKAGETYSFVSTFLSPPFLAAISAARSKGFSLTLDLVSGLDCAFETIGTTFGIGGGIGTPPFPGFGQGAIFTSEEEFFFSFAVFSFFSFSNLFFSSFSFSFFVFSSSLFTSSSFKICSFCSF